MRQSLKLFAFFAMALLMACGQKQAEDPMAGMVIGGSFESEILGRSVATNHYLPPNYAAKQTKMPLLVLLHGHGGDHMDWFQQEEGHVAPLLDSLIDTGAIPPVIAVSANAGNSWYVNSQEDMQDFFLDEWIPAIKEQYGADWNGSMILAGDSAGGYGGLRFALLQPDLFEAVVLLSPAAYYPIPPQLSSSRKIPVFAKDGVFNDSIWQAYAYPKLLEQLPKEATMPTFYLSVGDDDAYNIVPVVAALQQKFLERGIANELRITDGGHDWVCWRHNFVEALTDYFAEQ